MKRISLFALLLCYIASCTKDDSSMIHSTPGRNITTDTTTRVVDSITTFYIKGKVDGVAFKYFTGATATCKKQDQDITGLVLSAYSERTAKTSCMTLIIGAGSTVIKKGNYSEFDLKNLVAGGWSASVTDAYTSSRSKDNPFVLTITAMDEHVVTGTFSGAVFFTDTNAKVDVAKSKLITEGEFNIKYKE